MKLPILCLCLLALALPGVAHAQVARAQGLTAQEYLDTGSRLFLDRKYAEAAKVFQDFEAEFGKSTEAAPMLRATRFRLAMAFIHLKKYSDALEAIGKALAENPPLPPPDVQELTFWLGAANLQEENFAEARAALEKFIAMFPAGAERNPSYVAQFPAAARIPEARTLIGAAWLLEENFGKAAEHFATLEQGPADMGRSTVLRLYSLLQDGKDDEATQLVNEQFPRMESMAQLITFQTLALELGNRWLEKGEYRKAIACLQRVWPSERLLRHQAARLEELESRLEAVEAMQRPDAYTKMALGQLIQKVKRETEGFEKIESFDAALRLRLASAYQAMKRYREAALILGDMLDRMPPDRVVEQASVTLVQAWYAIERWPMVVEAARKFTGKFPESQSLPLVLYLEGIALQKESRFDESVAAFDTILRKHASSPFAPRALFMKGFTQLLAEQNKEALASFDSFPKSFPDHEMAEAALYWRGMAYSLDKQFGAAREAMDDYLRKYPDGAFAGAAVFRKAYCAQQLENYQTSIAELRAFLRKFPGHEETAEANVLLGDALMNEGQMEEGIAAFAAIPPEETRFYEEGVFKVAKALKLMEEYDRLLDHLRDFQQRYPRSPRVAEAVYQIGWVYRQRDEPDKARGIYWDAIDEHGADPAIRSVDDLFPALAKLYRGDDQPAYIARLGDLRERAAREKQPTLEMRALWAEAAALRRQDPAAAQARLLEAAKLADVESTNPLLLADFADALLAAGRNDEAAAMYRDLVKWNPRAPQKDRALAAMGFLELDAGNEAAALGHFDRFQREIPGSREAGRVLLAKADLLEKRGKLDEARIALEALLASQYSSGQEKAQALYLIGAGYLKEGKPKLAIPYFQRIYVMHGRWRDWVARAYLASGQAFEKIDDPLSARKTYEELLSAEDLATMPESGKARERLEALGGPLTGEEEPKG